MSSRKGSSNDKIDDRTGEYFTDIYFTELNKKGNWEKPIPLDAINSENHEGTLCLNQSGTTMFLLRVNQKIRNLSGCYISISQLQSKNWGPLNKLEVKVDSNTVIGHPTISPDEQYIIFSSRCWWFRRKDLWIVTRVTKVNGQNQQFRTRCQYRRR